MIRRTGEPQTLRSLAWLLLVALLGCSPGPRGTGPALGDPAGLLVEADGSLLVPDPSVGAVFRVDASTGDRSILVGPAGGLFMPTGVARERRGALLVGDAGAGEVLRVTDGARSVVARGFRGPLRLAALPDRRIAVLVEERNEIELLHPSTGVRALLTGPTRGGGPELDELSDLEVVEGRLLALNAMSAVIFDVDLRTGRREVVLDLRDDRGPPLLNPETMGPGGAGRLLVADDWTGRVVEVDIATGRRTLVGDVLISAVADPVRLPDGRVAVASRYWRNLSTLEPAGVLSGPTPSSSALRVAPGALLAHPEGLLVADLLTGAILRLQGDRLEEVSGPGRGSGPPLLIPLALAAGDGAAFVADRVHGLYRVDLASGDRTRVGPLPGLPRPMDLVAGPEGGLLYVSTALQSVLRVDPSTAETALVSGPGRGSGPPLRDTGRACLREGRLLVADHAAAGVVEVDLATGDRRLVAAGMPWPVFVLARADGSLVAADQTTNEVYVDGRALPSSGVGLYRPLAGVLQGQDGLLIADPGVADLIEVDLGSGRRRALPLARSPGSRPTSPTGR